MTLNEFQKKLKNKEYDSATNAKRAFGRAGFSDAEKARATKMVDKAFGSKPKRR